MKTGTQIPSSTGGTITFKFDKDGNQIGLLHKAGDAYSGKLAAQETNKLMKKSS